MNCHGLIEKTCKRCERTLPVAAFEVNKNLSWLCKDCQAIPTWGKRYPQKARDSQREYQREAKRKQRQGQPGQARVIFSAAVKAHRITPAGFCQKCGGSPNGKAFHGHHEDYSKPLDVTWLCLECHRFRTAEIRYQKYLRSLQQEAA